MMTAVLAKRRVAVPVDPVKVHSVDGRDYLLVEKLDERTLRVRRIKDTDYPINPYWRVWAQTVLCRVNSVRDLQVEITLERSTLKVSSLRPINEWFWIVRNALTAIQLLPTLPAIRIINPHGRTHVVIWKFTGCAAAMIDIVAGLRLPSDAWMHFRLEIDADHSGFRLVRRCVGAYSGGMRQREVRQLVELKVAQAYARTRPDDLA